LREREGFSLYGTGDTLAVVAANPIFNVLGPDIVPRKPVRLGEPFALPGGLSAELFTVPGKVALYLESAEPELAAESEVNVGVEVVSGPLRLVYVPGAAATTAALMQRLGRADVVFFDSTLFEDDEMIVTGTGNKTGRRMGHMSLNGAGGTLEQLAGLTARRILTHINNTNPILIEDSPQRRKVKTAGFEIAEDGMEIVL